MNHCLCCNVLGRQCGPKLQLPMPGEEHLRGRSRPLANPHPTPYPNPNPTPNPNPNPNLTLTYP
jgi:hypothetical protein